ncbi:MAG: M14 family zinc carboxypeptidase [Croceivirga sp.]
MNRILLPLLYSFSAVVFSQNLKSPTTFLGYDLGSQFTKHHEVIDYYEHVARAEPSRVKLVQYGNTNERRPLLLAIVSSEENLSNLESIRTEHLKSLNGEGNSQKAIVWLSYNVHGNEAVGTESSLKTIYSLLSENTSFLENTVVIIDPCLNPDGLDRYINWYYQYKNTPFQLDVNSKEHNEGWITGRSNHYMFDLNRDWAWLTQKESQERLVQYNKWMPHIHVDFHEQGLNDPYYFAPAAEPFHEVITNFQRDFLKTIGIIHAKYFDDNGWLYFTKERFDLFYPSYGDTYPTYNGSIGMTYEQGGSGRAGLGVITAIGDTLALKDRIAHHFTTGISTVEIASQNIEKLNTEFKKFFQRKNFKYKSYVLKGNTGNIEALQELLVQHDIAFGRANKGMVKGFNYSTGKSGSMQTDSNTLVVSTDQAKGTMVKVLFEPNAKLSDSLTYDITAWSLPYAYGLEAIASTNIIDTTSSRENLNDTPTLKPFRDNSYAAITEWNGMNDARFLTHLLKKGIRVRTTYAPFSLDGKSYDRGTLIITRGDYEQIKNLTTVLNETAKMHNKTIHGVATGFVEAGKDFGSPYIQMIQKPKIAALSGGPTSSYRFGEIWHFFAQQLYYPITVIDTDYADRIDFEEYDILILPGGRYANFLNEERLKGLKEWVRGGGKLIAMGGAIKSIDGNEGFGLQQKERKEDTTKMAPMAQEDRQRQAMKNAITGAIFKTKVDNTHPIAFGYDNTYFTLKLGSDAYGYMNDGNVVYLENNTRPVSGFAGSEAQKRIGKSLIFGVQRYGKGEVIYMVDNPLFRGFWENGKLFFVNALFMVR